MQDQAVATVPTETVIETKRDRVRRMLLDPLGFRSPKGVDQATERKFLDGLADELSYMADDRLHALMIMLRSKGEGKQRNQWPDFATFRCFAEMVQPRPLAELPSLIRWFRSVAGPKAIAAGTLVETWQWFEERKAPPVTPQAISMVTAKAADNRRRVQVLEEKVNAGITVDPGEAAFVAWYRRQTETILEFVTQERSLIEAGDMGDQQ